MADKMKGIIGQNFNEDVVPRVELPNNTVILSDASKKSKESEKSQ